MILRRRGRRQKPVGFFKTVSALGSDRERVLLDFLNQVQKPTADILESIASYRKIYASLTDTQQKNLIDKAVNQILYAHPDIVQKTLRNLRRISLDLGQKTEVLYRKLLINR